MGKLKMLKLDKNYVPIPIYDGDEIYRNGIFHYNITRILTEIEEGKLVADRERINIDAWFKSHFSGSINEDHLLSIDVTRPVIQAEIRPGIYSIIDGNHRMEKARREGREFIDSYKLRGEQLIPYFIDKKGYEAFIEYWNSKL